jgi:crotonobetainyl-CoA:carnitine CoA-transferase CaiB-like acyl-CoA transferase
MTGPLRGTRVLELGDGIASGYCGRLLGGFGATVIKVEPPGGSRLRRMRAVPGAPLPHPDEAPWWLYLGMSKRSLTAPLKGATDDALLRSLARRADVVIADEDPAALSARGLDYDTLSAENPRLVLTSLTPLGDWGPWSGWAAENLQAFAMGAQMWLTGEPGREPLATAGEQAWMQLGLNGFAATCFALYGARQTGLGQRVEVSAAEAMAGATEGFGPNARFLGVAQGRSGRARFSLMGIYPCADGYAGVYGTNRQLPLFSRIAGKPEYGADPRFQSLLGMLQHNEELSAFVVDYLRPLTRAAVRQVGRETGMTMAPVETIQDVAGSEHLRDRNFFVSLPTATGRAATLPGRPFNMYGTPWESKPAPQPGELGITEAFVLFQPGEPAEATEPPAAREPAALPVDRRADGLLGGVRVLDFTAYWAGPFATKWLADFGAEVVKVESPALMDFIRSTTVDPAHDRPWDYSAYFNNYSRGKRSLSLDPANPLGRDLILGLLPHFDVVIENFKAGRMTALGLTYKALKAVKPDIIMVSISGYGQDGSDSALAGVGTNMEQLSGLASLNRYPDSSQPYNTGIAYGDPTSGATGAAAVAMALIHRNRTGEGQYIEISGHETIASMIGEQFAALSLGLEPAPKGNRHPDMAPHGCYPCQGEDRWVTISVRSDEEWRTLCQAIGAPGLATRLPSFEDRAAAEDDIDAAIMAWTLLRGDYDAARELQAHGIPAAPVLSTLDVVTDPHFRLRGYHVTVDHPDQGPWAHDGVAWRLSRTPGSIQGLAPRFGEHTRELLRRYLGKSDAQIDAIYEAGAAADAPFRR